MVSASVAAFYFARKGSRRAAVAGLAATGLSAPSERQNTGGRAISSRCVREDRTIVAEVPRHGLQKVKAKLSDAGLPHVNARAVADSA